MDRDRQKIDGLIRELSALGYHSFQIDDIIKEAIGRRTLADASEPEISKVIEVLEEQVRFAAKCHTAQGRGK